MNISEAAKILGCSEKTIRRYIRKGALEARKGRGQPGQAWDISESSIEDFKQKLQSGVVSATIEKVDKAGQPVSTLVKLDTTGHLDMDIGHKLTAHPESFKIGRLGTQLGELPDVCDVALAAIFLGVSVSTVRDLLRDGKLKGQKLGRGWKISKYALENFAKGLGIG